MADTRTRDRLRFDELVVWYVNGTLSDADRAWVAAYLRDHPEANHEVHWHRELKSASDMTKALARPAPGLDKLLLRVREEERADKPGVVDRLLRFVDGLAVRPVMAVACVLVVVQGVALGFLVSEVRDRTPGAGEYEQTRGPDVTVAASGHLRVTFRSEATEREIRLLLLKIGGKIVGGPSQLGEYTVEVGPASVTTATAVLAGQGIVEQVVAPAKGTGQR